MDSFVATLVADVSSSSVSFLGTAIDSYWTTILSVLFVGFMIALFWRLAHKVFGR